MGTGPCEPSVYVGIGSTEECAVVKTSMRSVLATAALIAGFVLAVPSVAIASCIEPPPFEEAMGQATAVFVGTVVATDFEGRVATFEVTEAWKGSVPAETVVTGGPALQVLHEARASGVDVHSSVDRSYRLGATYVVFIHGIDDGVLLDNACSNTEELTDQLAALRPDTATAPELVDPATPGTAPRDTTPGSNVGWWIAGIAAAAFAAASAMAARRRRRRSEPQWQP